MLSFVFYLSLFCFPGDKYAMDLKSGNLLTPPNIKNVSCTHERYTHPLYYYIGPLDFIQAVIIFFLTIGIIGANLMLIFVINHRRYSPYIEPQVNFITLHFINRKIYNTQTNS